MARLCEMCVRGSPSMATVFCPADACYLCHACDEVVHSANRLAQRHVRRPVSHDDALDGSSSIGDESEPGLVPELSLDRHFANHSSLDHGQKDLLMCLPNTAPPVSYEDAAEYDFCDFGEDAGLGGKMPALGLEDDSMFGDAKGFGKSLYGEISWESVVPENVEHVVPDMSEIDSSGPRSSPGLSYEMPAEAVVPDSSSPTYFSNATATAAAAAAAAAAVVVASTTSNALAAAAATADVIMSSPVLSDHDLGKRESVLSESRLGRGHDQDGQSLIMSGSTAGHVAKKEAVVVSSKQTRVSSVVTTKVSAMSEEVKLMEERKKLRAEALVRFRQKRANRSFTKKVRYECRKQLANSRPRVKGRFVRKVEMVLFRKYGALYREHLDELDSMQPVIDECQYQTVPAL